MISTIDRSAIILRSQAELAYAEAKRRADPKEMARQKSLALRYNELLRNPGRH